jgi:hypothetical protein
VPGPAGEPTRPSPARAWLYLVWLSLQRQGRARQMVWIALALLVFVATWVGLRTTFRGGWNMKRWRYPFSSHGSLFGTARAPERGTEHIVPNVTVWRSFDEGVTAFELSAPLAEGLLPQNRLPPSPAPGILHAMATASRTALENSGLYTFSNEIVFSLFISFLMPIWCLSFATEALGGEREGRSLIWLLTRPLPRSSIYLAKYVGQLPWSLSLSLGGFAVLCLLGGPPGWLALSLYWPAVLWGTLAFTSLYHFMAAAFRRAAIVALLYSFFLETILGNMPGMLKRVSVSFYVRCLMFEEAQGYNVEPEKPSVYLPVDGPTALIVLMAVTALFLLAGMVWFSRTEYQDNV